ncbi:MAG: MMPL family transporter [Paludibacteraceae bacterium]|nr:MMPL family transporter [Paludibacteraceae bacterium]
MKKLFVRIFDWFDAHKPLLWGLLALTVILFGLMAVHIGFKSDITDFVPGLSEGQGKLVFEHLKVKDRTVVLFSLQDTAETDPDLLLEVAEAYSDAIEQSDLPLHFEMRTDPEAFSRSFDWIMRHLPCYLEEADYARLDSMLQPAHCRQQLAQDYALLLSPAAVAMGDVVLSDPFVLSQKSLNNMQSLGGDHSLAVYDGALFSPDFKVLVCFLETPGQVQDAAFNQRFSQVVSHASDAVTTLYPECTIQPYGAPIIGYDNASQIQRDLSLTMTVALVLIVLLVWTSMRSFRNIVLLIVPVLYGMLAALAFVWLVQGSISAIAVGTGSVVMGIALSYSVHVLSHANHCGSRRQLVEELAYPLTVGSITTIGAFIGLQFTQSPLLRDFGLFSACTLVATTLFCLIFLPHLLQFGTLREASRVMQVIDRINAYRYDRNKWLVLLLVVVSIVGFIYCNRVQFDYDMMHLNYKTQKIAEAEQRLHQTMGGGESGWLVTMDLEQYRRTADSAQVACRMGEMSGFASVASFLPDSTLQAERIARWYDYWTETRKAQLGKVLRESATAVGFKSDAFDRFIQATDCTYTPTDMLQDSLFYSTVMGNFVEQSDSTCLFLTRVDLPENADGNAYKRLSDNSFVAERSYYVSQMAEQINSDFDLILLVSSILIFVVLWISYRRVEMALLAFLPMCLSWVIITALMAITGIKFNIVNIVLSSFIFGVGDDFSIFVLDGLRGGYTDGRKTLPAHKTAIFFSSVITMIGMAALLFARHPAIHSLALVSLMGIFVVVLMAYVFEPLLFEMFVASPVHKGGFPHTLGSLLRTLFSMVVVLLSLLALHLLMPLLLPLKKRRRQYVFRVVLAFFARLSYRSAIGVRVHVDKNGEQFERPVVLVSNHQSLLDLLLVMGCSPKLIVVTQDWVWHKSPFALVVRYAGYIAADAGLESVERQIDEVIGQGCSIMIFPEGTRSKDFMVHRFRKGAFYVAEKWNLDLIISVMYGTGMCYSKLQPAYISRAWVEWRFMDRIPAGDLRFGTTYQDRAKQIRQYIQAKYNELDLMYRVPQNPYWKNCERRTWLYKESAYE